MKNLRQRILALILCFAMIFTSVNLTNLFNNKLNASTVPITEWNITPNISTTTTLHDKDVLTGRYQFNYTGASSGFAGTGYLLQSGGLSGNYNSGYSHLNVVSQYESGIYANSSGGYLDGSQNKEGSIYKAYLVIGSTGISDYANYPVTLIFGGEDGTPINGIKTKMEQWYNSSYPYNYVGYVDITDYIQSNGYGWYYCCNIPSVINYDSGPDWKIVVIEENKNINIRTLKFQFGYVWANYTDFVSCTIDTNSFTTKKQGTVTGQFFVDIANCDGIDAGNLQVYDGTNWTRFESTNGFRPYNSPVVSLKSKNTIPIKFLNNFTINLYWSGGTSKLSYTPPSTDESTYYKLNGDTVELLEIDGTTKYHNITLKNNVNSIQFGFSPVKSGRVLVVNFMGLAVDIDCPEYTTTQEAKNHDNYYVTIKGTTKNTSTLTEGIGMKNGEVLVTVDDGLKILSTTAYFTSANGTKTNLTSDMYEIDYDNNTIKYIYGPNANGQSTVGESLTYEIETFAIESDNNDGYKYTANNTVQASGYLVSNNVATDYYMDNVAWDNSSCTIDNPASVIVNDLIINPNGGSYKSNISNTTIKDVQSRTNVKVEIPVRDKYTFAGWKIEGSDSKIVDNNNIIMGSENTTITAQWTPNPLRIAATPNNNGFGSVTVDWSTYDYADKNFKVYKSEDGTNYESVGVDYTLVDEVKVLNLYPYYLYSGNPTTDTITFYSAVDKKNYTLPKSASLKMWMEMPTSYVDKQGNTVDVPMGYGMGIIKVTPVTIDDFNANPEGTLYDSNGNPLYDVIMFGTWDANANDSDGKGSQGLTSVSVDYIEKWIKAGKGFITGHDTLFYDNIYFASYMNQLRSYFNIKIGGLDDEASNDRTCTNFSTQVTISKKGLFTTYPWYIGDIGDVLTIPQTHNSGQIAYGDVWLTMNATNITTDKYGNGVANYFLTTNNNTASIMTGHSKCQATVDEQKIFANVLFYLFSTKKTPTSKRSEGRR